MNMLGVWGNENPKTGIWNGLFGKVGYSVIIINFQKLIT